jgi:hypothetical protein
MDESSASLQPRNKRTSKKIVKRMEKTDKDRYLELKRKEALRGIVAQSKKLRLIMDQKKKEGQRLLNPDFMKCAEFCGPQCTIDECECGEIYKRFNVNFVTHLNSRFRDLDTTNDEGMCRFKERHLEIIEKLYASTQ